MFGSAYRQRTAALLALYLVVATGLFFSERRSDGPMGLAGSATFHATAAAQDTLHASVGGFGDIWDRHLDLVNVREENERLRAELERLRDENTRLLGVMQENARLRGLVGFEEAHPQLDLVPSRVVAVDMSRFFRVTSVRLEARDARVEPGQPVVSSAGVVGYVNDVSGRYAEVTLAVDPRASIDVLVQRNRARGVIQGLGRDDDYTSRIAYLMRRDAVRPGDVVVTSGMGGRFPADLVVGRVAGVDDSTAGMFQEVRVEPAVDFARLEEVFIVVGSR